MSPFCTELTTLTPEQVAGGVSLAEACKTLRSEFDTKNRVWASFGDYDRRMFESCCREQQVRYPFGHAHINIRTLLPLAFGRPFQSGMMECLAWLDLEHQGTVHRGDDDAWNVARLLAEVFRAARGERERPVG